MPNAAPLDLAVLGLGVVGLTALRFAALERPDWRVAGFDRMLVGRGATQWAGGIQIPLGRTERVRGLTRTSIDHYRGRRRDPLGGALKPVSLYWLVRRESEAAFRAQHVGQPRATTPADRDRLARAHPGLALSSDWLVFAEDAAAYADTVGASEILAAEARGLGARLVEGAAITGVVRQADGLFRLDGPPDGPTFARRVLAVPGPWLLSGPSGPAAAAAGARIKKVVALHLSGAPKADDPALGIFDLDVYVIPAAARGCWICSYTCNRWDVAPDPTGLALTAEDLAEAFAHLSPMLTDVAARFTGARSFCDAYAPDRTPLLTGLLTDQPDAPALLAGCFHGSGFRLAPGLALEALRRLESLTAA